MKVVAVIAISSVLVLSAGCARADCQVVQFESLKLKPIDAQKINLYQDERSPGYYRAKLLCDISPKGFLKCSVVSATGGHEDSAKNLAGYMENFIADQGVVRSQKSGRCTYINVDVSESRMSFSGDQTRPKAGQ